ncbi:MAG: hypothetical protein Q8N90_00375 [bacterium]|nr:hypothetical protein [bacterium]
MVTEILKTNLLYALAKKGGKENENEELDEKDLEEEDIDAEDDDLEEELGGLNEKDLEEEESLDHEREEKF